MLDMGVQTAVDAAPAGDGRRWSAVTRIAFRFCCTYFGMYVLTTQMLGGIIPVPPLEELPPLRNLITWTAVHVFGITHSLVITRSGSGDKIFNWVAAFCLLVIASLATAIWSWLDRRRDHYAFAHGWFHLFLRFAAGSTMLSYGMVKVFPLQMRAPSLTRLLEPFGRFSPMGVLWSAIGAAAGYERFAGGAELAAAVCLFVPRLSLLGALILLADSIQIFTLNMTYDVPVKLFSFHLILISIVLLAPDARRLLNVLALDRAALPSSRPPLLKGPLAGRMLMVAQMAVGALLIVTNVASAHQSWRNYVGGPKSPLYGIWDVATMTIDGVERAPLVNDDERWKRVVFQYPNTVAFQRMDETFAYFGVNVDMDAKVARLTSLADPKVGTQLAFERGDPEHLSLDGDMDGRRIRMALRLFDHSQLPLLSRGFNWVQEYPFNR